MVHVSVHPSEEKLLQTSITTDSGSESNHWVTIRSGGDSVTIFAPTPELASELADVLRRIARKRMSRSGRREESSD